jgi:hypothetical protein
MEDKQTAEKVYCTEPVFVNLLRSPGIDSQPGESIPGLLKRFTSTGSEVKCPLDHVRFFSAGILEQSMGAIGTEKGFRTVPQGYIGWQNRFLGIDSWAP